MYDVLTLETGQYEQAVDVLRCKNMALAVGKPQDLIPIDRELMQIAHRSRQLERQRVSLMAGRGDSSVSLRDLIARMDPVNAARFETLRVRLLSAAHNVAQLNRDGESLLALSLGWIRETVALFVASPEGSAYNHHGGKGADSGTCAPGQSTVSHSV